MKNPHNYKKLEAEKSWEIVQLSPYHYRINGVIDVWPKNRKWMPTHQPQPSKQYAGIGQLKKILREVDEKRAAMAAKLAEAPKEKPVVETISHAEFVRLFS